MKKWLLFLLIFSIFLISCTFNPPSNISGIGNNIFQRDKEPVHQRGVNLEFVPGEPSTSENYEDVPFRVSAVLLNYGTNTPVSVELCVSDELNDAFGGIPADVCTSGINLEKAILERDGSRITGSRPFPSNKIELGEFEYKNIDQLDIQNRKTRIFFRGSYDYFAKINPEICLTARYFDDSSGINCNSKETITGKQLGLESQHSPITVTRIEKNLQAFDDGLVMITLRMTIENVGGGEIEYDIFSRNNNLREGPIFLEVMFNDNSGFFECFGSSLNGDELYLIDGKANIVCSAELDIGEEVFKSFLDIILQYRYTFEESLGPIILEPRFESIETFNR